MIKRIYEAVTGTPWTTGRSATADFGPTLATRYPEWAQLTDHQLLSMTTEQAIAWALAQRASGQPVPAECERSAALVAVR